MTKAFFLDHAPFSAGEAPLLLPVWGGLVLREADSLQLLGA